MLRGRTTKVLVKFVVADDTGHRNSRKSLYASGQDCVGELVSIGSNIGKPVGIITWKTLEARSAFGARMTPV